MAGPLDQGFLNSSSVVGQPAGVENTLSSYIGPYATTMLGKGAAVANQPYQGYKGQISAGYSDLQNQAFQGLANLTVPTGQMGAYQPRSFTGQTPQIPGAQQPMNPMMGQPMNPMMGQPMNPMMGQPMNPMMGQPMNPMMDMAAPQVGQQGMQSLMRSGPYQAPTPKPYNQQERTQKHNNYYYSDQPTAPDGVAFAPTAYQAPPPQGATSYQGPLTADGKMPQPTEADHAEAMKRLRSNWGKGTFQDGANIDGLQYRGFNDRYNENRANAGTGYSMPETGYSDAQLETFKMMQGSNREGIYNNAQREMDDRAIGIKYANRTPAEIEADRIIDSHMMAQVAQPSGGDPSQLQDFSPVDESGMTSRRPPQPQAPQQPQVLPQNRRQMLPEARQNMMPNNPQMTDQIRKIMGGGPQRPPMQDQRMMPTPQQPQQNIAQQYMNPYLQASLEPQIAEARRQADISRNANAGRLTRAGAFGGGRQAIMESEGQRNMLRNVADVTAKGYNSAYDQARRLFESEEARFRTGQEDTNKFGRDTLNAQMIGGNKQREIEKEGITADMDQFNLERDDPYKKLMQMQSLMTGLPMSNKSTGYIEPSTVGKVGGNTSDIMSILKELYG